MKAVSEVVSRNRIPIIVGGTGMYFNWILNGRPKSPPTDPAIMQNIQQILSEDSSWGESIQRLRSLDPNYAAKLNRNDYYRLSRALSIVEQTKKPLENFLPEPTDHVTHHCKFLIFILVVGWDLRCFYLTTDRWYLYRLIDLRCELMIQDGFLNEVSRLMRQGLEDSQAASKSIGYNEAIKFLKGVSLQDEERFEKSFQEFLSAFQSQSRMYVRRQDTWFGKNLRFCHTFRSAPFSGKFSFADCSPVLWKDAPYGEGSLGEIAGWIFDKFSIPLKKDFYEDPQVIQSSSFARGQRNEIQRDRKMLKYSTKLKIFSTSESIELVRKSLIES